MKKVTFLLLGAIAISFLSGCGAVDKLKEKLEEDEIEHVSNSGSQNHSMESKLKAICKSSFEHRDYGGGAYRDICNGNFTSSQQEAWDKVCGAGSATTQWSLTCWY